MFSGHTAHAAGIFLFTLFFSTYYSEKLAMLLSLLAIMITLIWSRMHYTSDVVVGFLLTVGYFFTAFEIEKIFL
jgi:membrane-associated phospholipid phosphatase